MTFKATSRHTDCATDRPDPLYDEKQTAKYLGVSVRTLRNWRWSGRGPEYVALSGRLIRYELTRIQDWVKSKRRKSTSDCGEAAA